MAGNTIPPEVAHSLEMLIEYLWPEESLDYELSSQQDRDRHIFNDVMVVDRWLSDLSKADSSAQMNRRQSNGR